MAMNEHETTPNTTTEQGTAGTYQAPADAGNSVTTTVDAVPPKPKQRRGFAAMDPRLVAQIASKGGKAAHAAGTAHEFTSDEARTAGRKGGLAPHQRRRTNAQKASSS